MRIALVLPHELGSSDDIIPSGISRYTMGLSSALSDRGHEVSIICTTDEDPYSKQISKGIEVIGLKTTGNSRFLFAEQVHELCLEYNYDVIEAHQSKFPLFIEQLLGRTATVTRYASGFTESILSGDFLFDEVGDSLTKYKVSKKELIWTEHLAEVSSIKRSNLVLCASVKLAQKAAELGCGDIHVLPLGLDSIASTDREYTLNQILISVCRFNDSRKGGDLVESIVRNIPKQYSIVVLGEMTDDHTQLRHRLLEDKRVSVISSPISRSNLESLYRSSQFCIVPTRSESFGYNLIEPLSFGIPTLCFTQDDKSGWPLCYMGSWKDQSSYRDIPNILSTLSSDYENQSKRGIDFSKQFLWKNLVDKYEFAYRSAMCNSLIRTRNSRSIL